MFKKKATQETVNGLFYMVKQQGDNLERKIEKCQEQHTGEYSNIYAYVAKFNERMNELDTIKAEFAKLHELVMYGLERLRNREIKEELDNK